ncbi:TlpA disulfide reductase family protein [Geobacillus sp. LEMMY01]|uniref:TlpA disulfide reductase family protein n=1 Tax=Geobacillus sp. LEMMY01 TaxID=1954237 RepID=UPI00111B315E|nr:TlpA disulfide reductase family protein [Geobacillus sp. LEMMY01]
MGECILQFGNIVVQGENLLLISGLLMSYVMFYYGIKVLKVERSIMDFIFNSFINGVLIWKFSYVVLHPNSVLQNPMTILYFNGGYVGISMAIVFITVYTWLYVKKQNIPVASYTRAMVPVYFGYFSTFAWIRVMENSQNYFIILQAIVAICFFIVASRVKTQKTLLQLLIWFHLIQFELALYKKYVVNTVIISKEVWLYGSLVIVFICISYWLERREREAALEDRNKGRGNVINQLALGVMVVSIAVSSIFNSQQEAGKVKSKSVLSTSLDWGKIGTNKGEVAPDFELLSITGDKIKLSDLRGKTVILNFWATWCPPCRAEMPEMQKFYENNKDSNVEILAVNLTNSERGSNAVSDFVEAKGITFKVVLDEQGDIGNLYGAITIPTSYIIDKNGVIRNKYVGPMSYETMDRMISGIQ